MPIREYDKEMREHEIKRLRLTPGDGSARLRIYVRMLREPNGYAYMRTETVCEGDPGCAEQHWLSEAAGLKDRMEGAYPEKDGAFGGEPPLDHGGGEVRRFGATNLEFDAMSIARRLDFLVKECKLAGYAFECCGAGIDFPLWGKSNEQAAQLVGLGSFDCPSGKLWVSDPCYAQDERLGVFLDGAAGRWDAYGMKKGQGGWGDRCSGVMAVRAGLDPLDFLCDGGAWEEAGSASVDSGQAGFFDAAGSFDPKISGGDDDAFYDACCGVTLGEIGFGAHPNGLGALSSSGDGDGCYPVLAAKGPGGDLLAVRILFYEQDLKETEAYRALAAQKAAMELDGAAARPGPGGKSKGMGI